MCVRVRVYGRATLQEETQLSAALQSKLRRERAAAAEAGTAVARLRAELAAAERQLSERSGLCDRLSQQLRLVATERLVSARQQRRELENACSRMGGALFGEEYQLPVQGLAESSDEEREEDAEEQTQEEASDSARQQTTAGDGSPQDGRGGAVVPVIERRDTEQTETGADPVSQPAGGVEQSVPNPPASRPETAATLVSPTDAPVKPLFPPPTADQSSDSNSVMIRPERPPNRKSGKKAPQSPVRKVPRSRAKKASPSPTRKARSSGDKKSPRDSATSPLPERRNRARSRVWRRASPEPEPGSGPALQSVVQRPVRRVTDAERLQELERRCRRPERFSGPLTGEPAAEAPPPPALTVPPTDVSGLQWPAVLAEFSSLLKETAGDDVKPRRAARYQPYESPLQPPVPASSG